MARTTILEYLDNFRRHAREVAYVHHRGYRMQRWTYGDVLTNAYRLARELEQRGIGKGDKVVIWGENCAEWVVAFFGCLLRGAIVVPIDKIAAPDFAQRVAQQVDARLCVGSIQNHISGVAQINLETLREQIAGRSAEPVALPPLTRDDIVQIVFTSGTTAEPRGVVISHGNILANLEPLEREIGKYLRYERIFPSAALLESASAKPRLRTVPRDLSAAIVGRHSAFSGHAEPDGSSAGHQARTRVGGGRGPAPDGIAEGQTPPRF